MKQAEYLEKADAIYNKVVELLNETEELQEKCRQAWMVSDENSDEQFFWMDQEDLMRVVSCRLGGVEDQLSELVTNKPNTLKDTCNKTLYDIPGKDIKVALTYTAYTVNNTLAVMLKSSGGALYCALSVNLGSNLQDSTHIFLDTNNFPQAEEFVKMHNLGRPAGKTVASGFCTYPLYEMFINQNK